MKKIYLSMLLFLFPLFLFSKELGIGQENMSNVSRLVDIFVYGSEVPLSSEVQGDFDLKVIQASGNRHESPLLETWIVFSGEGFYSDIFNLGDLGECFRVVLIDSDLLSIWCGNKENPVETSVIIEKRVNMISIKVKNRG
ncbi:hypothetical protein [Pleionea sediminis]|uniref:hypothetical protein n=1 Tax=Pleionea sediminis TaxID=2569479 RepID=UPI001185DF77|nr:hypothetical protein [Pleionea sediminis]